MLSLHNVTLTYPDGDSSVTALRDVSLEVQPGQCVAITGPSGSGKSSLLSVASTLTTLDSGSVVIDGVDVTGLSNGQRADVRRERLGIVFQSPNLIPSLTVAEQLEVVARMGGGKLGTLRGPHLQERIHALLAEVGMEGFSSRLPGQLSGGQRQRVNIARAIIHSPRVLVVDEPTSALDTERSTEVMELLRRTTRAHNLATVVVTHDDDQLAGFDAVYRMVDGNLSTARARLV